MPWDKLEHGFEESGNPLKKIKLTSDIFNSYGKLWSKVEEDVIEESRGINLEIISAA